MLEIPAVLAEKAYRFFGDEGRRWLGRLPRLLAACAAKWRLRDCRVSPVISINYICFAESPEYGPVALKVGVPNPELWTEIRALQLFGGRHICRLHDQDVELGAMLLERLVPGHDLTSIADPAQRAATAAGLIAGLPVPHGDDPSLPSWRDWMRRAFARARREGKAPERLLGMVDQAEVLFDELEREGRPSCLLHGDLNHWNMLFDARAGAWKAIDPKGAVGPGCLEAGRFIINELEMQGGRASAAFVNQMASMIGEAAGEPPRAVVRSGFLDCVLSTVWTLEEYVPKDITRAVDHCQLLLGAYRKGG